MVWFSCNIVSTAVIYFFLPESANKTIEEMGDLFGDEVIVHMAPNGLDLLESKSIPLKNTAKDESNPVAETVERV